MKAFEEGISNEVTDTLAVFADADYDSVTSTPADFRRLDVYKRQALIKAGQGYAGKVLRRQCIREKRGQYS